MTLIVLLMLFECFVVFHNLRRERWKTLIGTQRLWISTARERVLYSIGATRSISCMQWRGGSGSSSVDAVMRTSVPQFRQRN